MPRIALIAAMLALPLTACGAAQQPESASKFKGDQAAVAELVDQLAAAGKAGDAEKICTEILSKQLVTELKSAGGDCVSEMDRAIDDASDFNLTVRTVKVNGNTATAQVRQGDSGANATFTFVKEGGKWRASELGSGS
jgi:type 1 fimbria pilin